MAYDDATQQLVLFGGDEGTFSAVQASQDTWTWDGTSWTQQSPANVPDGRFAGTMAYDAATQQVIMFGGNGSNSIGQPFCNGVFCNDTWAWNGAGWTKLNPAHSPPGLSAPSMAYDAANGTIVLFGGGCQSGAPGCVGTNPGLSNATWIWNGSDWSQASPSQSPVAMSFETGNSMAYDPASGTVIFSTASIGIEESSTTPGTWEWNGSTWSESSSYPSAGSLSVGVADGLAYDTEVQRVVLHGTGSLEDGFTEATQTWAWDGQQWSRLLVPDVPRHVVPSMAFDAAANVMLMFGGLGGQDVFGPPTADQYTFNGRAWSGGVSIADLAIPSPTQDINRPHCDCGLPVDTASGNFWHTFTDFAIPGRGLHLDLERTYNSIDSGQNGRLGFGWTDSYSSHLTIDASTGNATLNDESGGALTFTSNGNTLSGPPGTRSSLTKNANGSYTLTRHDKSALTFNSTGELVQEADRNSYTTVLTYSGGQLSTISDPAGRTLTLTYGSNGDVASVADPLGRTVTYAYDAAGNLTGVTDPNGGQWTFTYDGSHRMLTMTDPRGGVVSNTYDASGRLATQTDPLQRTTSYSYQVNETVVTDPRGVKTLYVYDLGELQAKTVDSGSFPAENSSYGYDGSLNLTDILGSNGTTHPTWNTSGDMVTLTDPAGNLTSYTYNAFNEPTSITDGNGVTTTLTYDGNGNLTSTSTPLNATSTVATSYTYGDTAHPGDVTKMTDPDGRSWTYSYDQDGNQLSSTDPAGDRTTRTYDLVGRMTSETTPDGNISGGNPSLYTTTYRYDPLDRLVATILPLAGNPQMSYTYDANGNMVSTIDPDGNTTRYVFDLDNEQTEVDRADGSTLKTTYDPDGNKASQVDGFGQTTTNTYDSLNRLATATDPLGRQKQYMYDSVGDLLQLTDAKGQVTSYSYDADRNVTLIHYQDATTPNASFTYDHNNRRLTMTDGTGTNMYTYDALGRLTSLTTGSGAAVGYTHDPASQLTAITYPNGKQVNRGYDSAGRITSVTDWLGNTTKATYDADSALTSETYPNGVTASFAYDSFDRMTSAQDAKGTSTLFQEEYARSAGGLVTQSNAVTYSYDGASRLTGATSPTITYGYDAADRLTSSAVQGGSANTLAYDQGDQLQSLSSSDGIKLSYAYDANGNRSSVTDQSNQTTALTYDMPNRLTSWGTTATYTYNGDSLRATKTVSGTTENFTWDVSGPLPQLIADGATSFVDGPNGAPLEQVGADGTVLYFHQDQLGSTRLMTDTNGNVAATFAYDPYGRLSSHTGTASTSLLFGGQFFDTESGLYYMQARYYDPAAGQFITSDPLVNATGEPYTYAGDNPVNSGDPRGLACINVFGLQIGDSCSNQASAKRSPGYPLLSIGQRSDNGVIEWFAKVSQASPSDEYGWLECAVLHSGASGVEVLEDCGFDYYGAARTAFRKGDLPCQTGSWTISGTTYRGGASNTDSQSIDVNQCGETNKNPKNNPFPWLNPRPPIFTPGGCEPEGEGIGPIEIPIL